MGWLRNASRHRTGSRTETGGWAHPRTYRGRSSQRRWARRQSGSTCAKVSSPAPQLKGKPEATYPLVNTFRRDVFPQAPSPLSDYPASVQMPRRKEGRTWLAHRSRRCRPTAGCLGGSVWRQALRSGTHRRTSFRWTVLLPPQSGIVWYGRGDFAGSVRQVFEDRGRLRRKGGAEWSSRSGVCR